MRAAVFAQQIGRAVAFSLAAFRQAFAAGRDLSEVDNVVIAAAACELHPNALLKAIETQAIKDRLQARPRPRPTTSGCAACPRCAVGDRLFCGDDHLEEAAEALGDASGIFRPRGAPGTVRLDGDYGQDHARQRRAARRSAARSTRSPTHDTCRLVLEKMMPHPPLRGARGRDVRQGQDRRLPPPLHRRGGDGRGRHPGASRHRLPDVHLPRARPGDRARHAARAP